MELITSVLRDQHMMSGRIDGEAFPIAYTRGEPPARGKPLVRFVRVIAPDAAAGFEFGTRVDTRRFRRAILLLAGIGCTGHVDIERAIRVNRERMHGVVAAKR